MAIVRSNEELNKYAESKVAKVTSTDDAIVRFDGTTGEVQDSSVTISDSGAIELKGSGREIRLYASDGTGYGKVGNASNAAGGIALKGYSSPGFTSYVDLSAISTANAGIYRIGRDSNIAEGQIAEFQIYKHDGTAASTFKINCKTGDIMNMGALNISKVAATNGSLESNGNVFSGTYTPALTNVTNVTSSSAFQCQYMRVGDVVTVSGYIQAAVTTGGATALVRMSVPIASSFTSVVNLAGTAVHQSTTIANNGYGQMQANTTLNNIDFRFLTGSTATTAWFFTFTYRIS